MQPKNLPRRFFSLSWSLCLWMLAQPQGSALPGVEAAPAPNQLEIRIGPSGRSFEPLKKGPLSYYSLQELSALVGLDLREEKDTLTVIGSIGSLQLVDGRPLVRAKTQYLLLSAPVWVRAPGEWYVTEDFLTSALPLATSRRISKISDGRYRLEELPTNDVHVEVQNHPTHVRLLFHSTHPVDIEVEETESDLVVAFKDLPVQPHFPATPPDQRFVTSVQFDSRGPLGSFRIAKGKQYGRFTETPLSDGPGTMIDIFGVDQRHSPPNPSPDRAIGPPLIRRTIAIDPGHGGDDHGVTSPEGLMEKILTLKLANALGDHLTAHGYGITLTRTRDVELTADQRSAVGNHYGAQAFISIHVGASQSLEKSGPVVYFHRYLTDTSPFGANPQPARQRPSTPPPGPGVELVDPESRMVPWTDGQKRYLSASRQLAQQLQQDLNLLWGTANRSWALPLGVLAPVTAPAVMVEIGYLTSTGDVQKLQSEDFRKQLANTIASTLLAFLESRQMEEQGLN